MVIKPSGDIDRDFVAMMVPHHQGAIAMAQAEMRYGHSKRLRCLAKEMVAAKQREITALRLAIGEDLTSPVASPAEPDAMPRGALKMNTMLE
jgi:uncharacterized protein (DUF305 family)